METRHEFFGVELLVQCSSCAQTTPVNRPESRTLCSNCLRETEVDDAAWGQVLSDMVGALSKLGMGVTESGKLDRPGRDVEWTRGPDRPKCPSCKQSLRAAPDGKSAVCSGCARAVALEPPPPFLSGLERKITASWCEPSEAAPVHETKKLGMSCTQCGASIASDGSTRTVDCPYCKTTNILPDDVWRALHPPKLRQRFWLLYALSPDPRQVTPKPAKEARNSLIAAAVALAFVSLIASGCTASCVTGKNHLSGDELLPYFPFWFGALFVPVVISVLIRWSGLRTVIRADQEVVGKLGAFREDHTDVEVFDPSELTKALGTRQLPLTQARHRELGGEGAYVRAWANRKTSEYAIRPLPSGLV